MATTTANKETPPSFVIKGLNQILTRWLRRPGRETLVQANGAWIGGAALWWAIHYFLAPVFTGGEPRPMDFTTIQQGICQVLGASLVMYWFWSRVPWVAWSPARSIFGCAMLVIFGDALSVIASEVTQAFWASDIMERPAVQQLKAWWPAIMVLALNVYLASKARLRLKTTTPPVGGGLQWQLLLLPVLVGAVHWTVAAILTDPQSGGWLWIVLSFGFWISVFSPLILWAVWRQILHRDRDTLLAVFWASILLGACDLIMALVYWVVPDPYLPANFGQWWLGVGIVTILLSNLILLGKAWPKLAVLERSHPMGMAVMVILALALVVVGHHAGTDRIVHPRQFSWVAWLLWKGVMGEVAWLSLTWLGWTMVTKNAVRPAMHILAASVGIMSGYLLAYVLWRWGGLEGRDAFVDYWYYWSYWPAVVIWTVNLRLLKKGLERIVSPRRLGLTLPRLFRQHPVMNALISSLAVMAVSTTVMLAALHIWLPRAGISDWTLSLARDFLVADSLGRDFDFLTEKPAWQGKRLKDLLEHVELANRQRGAFYPRLEDSFYQSFVLSPAIDNSPISEWGWRRELWEAFQPQVGHEKDPTETARIVVHLLRQRVGINPACHFRVGVETIWRQQMTDSLGFERIYVAALRSVGIAARLSEHNQAEFWSGTQWQPAPHPVILRIDPS